MLVARFANEDVVGQRRHHPEGYGPQRTGHPENTEPYDRINGKIDHQFSIQGVPSSHQSTK